MSFLVNNNKVQDIAFNGSNVTSVYYNGQLAWYKWPGDEKAGIEDYYMLCKLKQSGVITEWPDDLVKSYSHYSGSSIAFVVPTGLEDTFGSPYEERVLMRLIGIDVDGPGVLTFMAGWAFNRNETTKEQEQALLDVATTTRGNNLKQFIKPLQKWSCSESGVPVCETRYIWDASCAELGVSCDYPSLFTDGVTTPYYSSPPVKHVNHPFIYSSSSIDCEVEYYTRDFDLEYSEVFDRYFEVHHTLNKNGYYVERDYPLSKFSVPCFAIG